MPATKDRWINSSGEHLLRRHGITCSRSLVERGLQTLYDRYLIEARIQGISPGLAKRDLHEKIAPGENRRHRPIWKIRESSVGLLRDWVAEEKHWLSLNNTDRTEPLGLTCRPDTLDFTAAQMYREFSQPLHAQGTPDDIVRFLIERKGLRKGASEQGRPVWQIHEKFVPALKARIAAEHQARHEPGWINSHNRIRLREMGIKVEPAVFDAAIERYYDRLREQYHTPYQQVVTQVNFAAVAGNLRRATTEWDQPSWDIQISFLPRLVKELGPELKRREPDWPSERSRWWRMAGIHARGTTLARAMQTLREQEIARRVAEGMDPQAAAEEVAEKVVKHGYGKRGTPVFKATREQAPALLSIIQAMPHYETHGARVAATKPTTTELGK